jgi:hypothetical protein
MQAECVANFKPVDDCANQKQKVFGRCTAVPRIYVG